MFMVGFADSTLGEKMKFGWKNKQNKTICLACRNNESLTKLMYYKMCS